MIGYSLLDDEKPQAVSTPVIRQPSGPGGPSGPYKQNAFIKIKTECDLVVMGFVIATILLLISDVNK